MDSFTNEQIEEIQFGLDTIITYSETKEGKEGVKDDKGKSLKPAIPFSVVYNAMRWKRKTKEEISEYSNAKNSLLSRHGAEFYNKTEGSVDKNGKQMLVPTNRYDLGDNKEAFQEEIKPLSKEAHEISGVKLFQIEDLKPFFGGKTLLSLIDITEDEELD